MGVDVVGPLIATLLSLSIWVLSLCLLLHIPRTFLSRLASSLFAFFSFVFVPYLGLLEELGKNRGSVLPRIVKCGYRQLKLQYFFTAGEKEVRQSKQNWGGGGGPTIPKQFYM